MNNENAIGFEPELQTIGRDEVVEMHLFDENASDEEALCGADAPDDERRSVIGYLEDRFDGHSLGTVCRECKAQSLPFAVKLALDPEDERPMHEAEEYGRLAETLTRETGLSLPDD